MKILNNNSNGCRHGATEAAAAWQRSKRWMLLAGWVKIEARFHEKRNCGGRVVRADVQRI